MPTEDKTNKSANDALTLSITTCENCVEDALKSIRFQQGLTALLFSILDHGDESTGPAMIALAALEQSQAETVARLTTRNIPASTASRR